MQLYHFTNRWPGEAFNPQNHKSVIAGTRSDAKDQIRTVLPDQRAEHFVELLEFNGKAAMIDLVNGARDFTVLKRWKFTGRGALRECDREGKYIQGVEL